MRDGNDQERHAYEHSGESHETRASLARLQQRRWLRVLSRPTRSTVMFFARARPIAPGYRRTCDAQRYGAETHGEQNSAKATNGWRRKRQ